MGDFWKPTFDMYSSLFEKPKMSQKLLEKPPFKYIFDIIMESIKVTGFGKGLLKGEELDGNWYDSKEKKIDFLQKVIDLTQLANKEQIQAKPSKIVAGLEPELTNALLQSFYKAVVSGKNSDAFVKKITSGDAPPKGPAQPQQPAPSQDAAKPKEKPSEPPKPKEEPPKPKEEPKPKPQQPAQQAQPPPPQQQQKAQPPPPQQPAQQDGNVRPSTAKKRPPQLPQSQVVGDQGKKQGTTNVIIEGKGKDDDDDGIVTEQQTTQKQADLNPTEHSKFVRDQIQKQGQMQKEEEAPAPSDGPNIQMSRITKKPGKGNQNGGSIVNQIMSNLGTSQVPDTLVMQTLIQQICQNSNPLGKQIEFIQDDIESMNYEMQQWRKVYNNSKQKMIEMSKATEEAQQPLFDKIAEVEEGIKEKKTKIQHLKAQIIKNKIQIDQLLRAVLVQK